MDELEYTKGALRIFGADILIVDRELPKVEKELAEIREIVEFYEYFLKMAEYAKSGGKPNLKGKPFPDQLQRRLEMALKESEKKGKVWEINLLTKEDFVRTKYIFTFSASRTEKILFDIFKKLTKEKKERLTEEQRKKRDELLGKYLVLFNKRQELAKRADAIIKKIFEGGLDPILVKPIKPV